MHQLNERKDKLGPSFQRDYFETQKDVGIAVRFLFLHNNLFMWYGLDFDFIKIP